MTGRQKAIAFFITLGVCLTTAAVALNVTWILIHWRRLAPLVLGVIFFGLIIAGLIVYTVFIVREIRRNEQHDSFINAVTHELKTPIASIRLYLETLQSRDVDPAKRQEFYSVMLADTERLHYTVEQVLKAGVAGQRERKRGDTAVNLEQLLAEIILLAKLRHHLDTEALTFAADPRIVDPIVKGDPEELRTAVSNLVDNAVKYSPHGVRVKVGLSPGNNGNLLVSVRDEGVGIPRNQLKLIFRRFYRVPGRALLQVKGTGLGLYIVKSIAKKHGGRVFAESEGEGKGSTFTLELPKARD
jgi:two-component system, OmpR family, sensor histidine kinase SenX3